MRKQGKKWAAFLLCCLLLPVTPVKAETAVIAELRKGKLGPVRFREPLWRPESDQE